MNRIRVLTQAVADAWKTGQPDGLLLRELVNEYRKVNAGSTDKRTENRVREHGGHWREVEYRSHVFCLNGPGVLMRCPPPCNWLGWIKTSV